MSADDVLAELRFARACINDGLYKQALTAIDEAIKAWAISVDLWQLELYEAEKAARDDI